VLVSRVLTVAWGVAQMGVAYAAWELGSDESVVKRVLAIAGFTTGLLLGLFVLGTLRVRVASWAAIWGLVCGFVTVFLAWLPSTGLTADLTGWVPEFYKKPFLAWPWFAPLGAGTTVVVALLLNLFSPPHGPAPEPADRSPESGLDPAR
jgi:hypothetical protein